MMSEKMITLYRDVSAYHGYGLSNVAGIFLAIGIFLGPGLVIAALITRNFTVIVLAAMSLLAIFVGALLNQVDSRLQKSRFLSAAGAEGIANADAEEFLKTVDWDKVFPEYD